MIEYFKQWYFRPGLWPTTGFLIFFPLLMSLGFWQLDRAEQKRIRHETFIQRQATIGMKLDAGKLSRANLEDLVWRSVIVTGVFNEDVQILLDNQVMDSIAGYYVFTPFIIENSDKQILVNRGWVPVPSDRSVAPELVKTTTEVTIEAVLKKEPPTGLELKQLPPQKIANGIYRAHKIDLTELSGITGANLFRFVLRLKPDSKHGYHRVWSVPGSKETMHIGYAFQWFALALLLLIIYLVLNIKRQKV